MTVEEIATKADIEAVLQEVKALAATVNKIASIKPGDDDLMTRKEVAEMLRISLPTLSEMTQDGRIPGRRTGRKIVYRRRDVLKSLEVIKSNQYKR